MLLWIMACLEKSLKISSILKVSENCNLYQAIYTSVSLFLYRSAVLFYFALAIYFGTDTGILQLILFKLSWFVTQMLNLYWGKQFQEQWEPCPLEITKVNCNSFIFNIKSSWVVQNAYISLIFPSSLLFLLYNSIDWSLAKVNETKQ